MKEELVLSIYMTVEGTNDDEIFDKAEEAVDELFEKDVARLDSMEGFAVVNWLLDWTNM